VPAIAGSNRTERSQADSEARMGIATTREWERAGASLGAIEEALPVFGHDNNICNAGVLFILPALLSQGLLKGAEIYGSLKKGYYGLISTLLLLAFMALSRIKTPEQLKTCKPGELGKLLGLDRIPEAKCLRAKIGQIAEQQRAQVFNHMLARQWIRDECTAYFYIDGHVRVYHGDKAHLTKKYVSREKLCLAGTTEFWVNNELGLPYLVFTGELNEKLKEVIASQIIPALLKDTAELVSEKDLKDDPKRARFTIIFDREAYEPSFFKSLWEDYRIAVVTYRKGVKDSWHDTAFTKYTTEVIGKEVTMALAERSITLSGMEMREIRKRTEDGHQTSIITTNEQIRIGTIAGKMFSRWSQENFFRYMVQDYDIDKALEYGIEAIEPHKKVVNPSYKHLSYHIKKLREKQNRLKAKFYQIVEKNLDSNIDQMKKELQKQVELQEKILALTADIDEKLQERKQTPYYIQLKDMPVGERYNKLKTESKLFMNTIKMIAYRAETAVANILVPYYKKAETEMRMLVKEIIKSDADLIPDYENKTLTIRLHSMSTPRANKAVLELCKVLNETETIYPNTNLKLIYKTV